MAVKYLSPKACFLDDGHEVKQEMVKHLIADGLGKTRLAGGRRLPASVNICYINSAACFEQLYLMVDHYRRISNACIGQSQLFYSQNIKLYEWSGFQQLKRHRR
jgi:hypothetical protein